MTIFINGKQKRVRRPPEIDGLPVDEFIARNADPIWLHQNGDWDTPISSQCQANNRKESSTKLPMSVLRFMPNAPSRVAPLVGE
jgi:hypothetical protein